MLKKLFQTSVIGIITMLLALCGFLVVFPIYSQPTGIDNTTASNNTAVNITGSNSSLIINTTKMHLKELSSALEANNTQAVHTQLDIIDRLVGTLSKNATSSIHRVNP